MSGQLVIDPVRFARDRVRLAGSLGAADLPRFSEQVGLDPAEGERAGAGDWRIGYEVAGHLDDHGRPALWLKLDGIVPLRCQRCLGVLITRIDSQREIVLVAGADEFASFEDEDESSDVIPAVSRLDLRGLLEDEALLGLPIAPRHADGACEAESASPVHSEPSSAFAALAKLKRD